MRRSGGICLSLVLAFWITTSHAEELKWRPAGSTSAGSPANSADLEPKFFRLGRPIGICQQPAADDVQPVSATVRQQAPESPSLILRAQTPGGVPPVPPPPLPGGGLGSPEAYNCAVPTDPLAPSIAGAPAGSEGGFYGYFTSIFVSSPNSNRGFLQSDHAFDSFISPVTNPHYFEDPRALTEFRTIYTHQETSSSNPVFAGGSIDDLTLQGRLAITDRFTIVLNRLGWIWTNPNGGVPGFDSAGGFAELYIGPKFTIIRNDCTKTLLAAGLTFEIPVGDADVFQNTGDLSLTPYFSFGQEFWETSWGRFHFLNSTGYSISVDSERSEFLFSSFHLDYDIANLSRFYPFIEMNYFVYTKNGNVQDLSFEGLDLIRFGSRNVTGNNDLSLAVGGRIKFTEVVQFGAAVEFPLIDDENLMDYRLTFDFILRY